MVGKFRQRYADVEAVYYTGDNIDEVRAFTRGRVSGVFRAENGVRCFRLSTATGFRTVYPGTYIGQTGDGQYFPMEQQTFERQYVPVTNDDKT